MRHLQATRNLLGQSSTRSKLDSSELDSTQTRLEMRTSRVELAQTRTQLASLPPLFMTMLERVANNLLSS